jgi:exo-1,4-beta-D-glucosaminidase
VHPFIQLDKWQLCSSEKLSCYGETISVTDYKADGWYTVSVPQTVVGGLVENGVYEDPYYGLNMKKIPGYKHGRKMHFSFYPMPDDSPFRKSWWYRTEFSLDTCKDAGEIWLWIRGINYSAHVWINGRRAAGADYVTGSYRTFELSITNFLEGKQKNCIALELIPPQTDDLCLTFVDWCPVPPDDSMGIWQPIGVYTTGPIAVRYPFVQSRVHLPAGDVATLSIDVELVNSTSEPATGFLCCETETFHIQSYHALSRPMNFRNWC